MEPKKDLEGSPAGLPADTGGQQPVGVLVASARDQRVLDWLVSQVGREAVEGACTRLAGRRRPYVSNIAKELGVIPPDNLTLTPRAIARQRLAECKAALSDGKA